DSGEVSYREVKRLVEKEIEYDSYDSFGDYDPEYGDTQFFIPGVEDLDENTALRDAILAGEACWLRSLSEMPEDEAEIAEWRHTFLSQDGGTVSETDMKETMPTRFYFIMN
ncbi:MAG: hypothetical protein SPL71_03820, partial [Oribacterium sp.]|nr:hypothetical protein [Oribacterium sp.]